MVISKAISRIIAVKSSHRLPFNGCTEPGMRESQEGLVQLPAKDERVDGERYLHKGNVCMWKNGVVCCEHGRLKRQCKECGGSAICEHGRRKYECKECGGSGIRI